MEGEAAYAVAPNFTLKALSGHRWAGHRPDRSYWSLGGVATWKTLALEVRYQDTNLPRSECGFSPDICGQAVVGTLTINLPPIL